MANIRQLYELQGLDSEIELRQRRLAEVKSELGDRGELDHLEEEMAQQSSSLKELQLDQQRLELDAEGVRQKLKELETKLYGGSVKVPRELEGMQLEATYLRTNLQGLDDQLLESMMTLEAAQQGLKGLGERHRSTESEWVAHQEELAQERERLTGELKGLGSRRKKMTSPVDSSDLKLYERLRSSKGGQAVALLERGLCRACRMTIPTHQLQRARSGREVVLCNSCGRMLFVS